MAKTVAYALGRAARQVAQGDWIGAAATLDLKVWAGRYVGCFAVIAVPVVSLASVQRILATQPISLPSGADLLFVACAGLALPAILLPLGIWTARSALGQWSPKLKATTFVGGFIEGAVVGLFCVAVIVLVSNLNSIGGRLRPPASGS